MRAYLLFSVMFSIGLFGCGGDDDNGRTPEQACLDLADSLGDLCERCQPGSYTECYNELLKVADGDCANIKDVRDMDLLYSTCIPWFGSVDCEYFLSGNFELDSSCKGQLLK